MASIAPSVIKALQTEARKTMFKRKHCPSTFARLIDFDSAKLRFRARCIACGDVCDVVPRPAPNEIAIGGEAVARNCFLSWEYRGQKQVVKGIAVYRDVTSHQPPVEQ